MERLLSLVVIRTVQLSEWTSIEYATADGVPAIEVLRLAQVSLYHRASALPALESQQKGGIPTLAIGAGIPPVVVKGKCQGLMFSDFVSPAPFKRLGLLSPHLRQAFAS